MKKNLALQLLIALVLAFALGLILRPYQADPWLSFISKEIFAPLGQVFLKIVFMVVIPLLFSAVVLGVSELGSEKHFGKVLGRSIGLTLLTSVVSVFIGITLVNVFKPGLGLNASSLISEHGVSIETVQKNASQAKSSTQAILDLIPRNPLEAAVKAFDGELLAFMVFSVIFGIALSAVMRAGGGKRFRSFVEEVFQICLKIVDFAMRIAPYSVFALVFNSSLKMGGDLFRALIGYVLVVVAGLLVQQFGVYSVLLKLIAKRSPIVFFKACWNVMITAFSTASSNATLPYSIKTAEEKLKLKPEISRFVLTVGATANQNGTALFEGVTVLFLAQVFGVNLGFGEQIQVVLMSILAGIGTAGVPGGSLPLILILLQNVGVPPEGLALVLGVDRLLDMCRTTVNVSGDLVIATCVSELDKKDA